MIKGLRAAGLEAEQAQRIKEREAKAGRAKASKKAAAAMAGFAELEASFKALPAPTGLPAPRASGSPDRVLGAEGEGEGKAGKARRPKAVELKDFSGGKKRAARDAMAEEALNLAA